MHIHIFLSFFLSFLLCETFFFFNQWVLCVWHWMHPGKPEVDIRYLRRVLSWFGDRVSHWLNWSSPINYTQWPAIPESQNLHASIFQHWYYTYAPHRFSHVQWGSKLRSPCFRSKQFTQSPFIQPSYEFCDFPVLSASCKIQKGRGIQNVPINL